MFGKPTASMRIRRYLVTGCAGFIGAAVCRRLLRYGYEVWGLDDLSNGYDPALKQYRLRKFARRHNFGFKQLDISDREELGYFFADEAAMLPEGYVPFDAVINLAARAGVRASVENPWQYYQTNTQGTLNLLELCRRYRVPKFVLASTSSLYGEQDVPFRETQDTSHPLSPYAASKKAAETLAHTYHHLHGLDVTVLRYFTVYGPAGRPDMSMYRFIRWIAEGEPLDLYGDGGQSRDFTYIDDVARGTVAALRPLGYQVVNLGGNRPVTLSKIIGRIEELLGRKADIRCHDAHPADVRETWAQTTRARLVLGWRPSIGIDEGLRRCVEWYQRNRDFARQVSLDGPCKTELKAFRAAA